METTSHLSQINTFDIMSSSEPHNFLKLEDLDNSSSPAGSFGDISLSQDSPPPQVIVHSKPAKKRKSWGQQLPEPKTTLPPRKRAKTEDEKEQRRIERIKRNRAAAHNSRERKRQETDTLAVALARANAELEAYRRLHGPLPASVVLPEVTLSTDDYSTPAPSLIESRGSIDLEASPATVTDDLFDSTVMIKEEPSESLFPTTLPPAFNLDAKSSTLSLLDPTQHSAAMLCDLQCRSSSESFSNNSTTSASNTWWAALFLYLTTIQLQTTYKAILMTLWSLSPSRTARLMQASTLRLTSRSTTSSTPTPLLSHLTLALAQRNAATARLRARQGALALQRRSMLVEAERTRVRPAAARQHQIQNVSDTMAFEEHTGMSDLRNQDDDGGVGHQSSKTR